MNTYNYKGELFSFGGLGFKYKNKFKNLEYELGRVRGIKDETYTIGNQMLGFQLSNYEIKPKTYRELSGQVADDSLVKLWADGKEETTLSTYDGYYSLNSLNLSQEPKSIKLEEVKADGTCEKIYEMKYPKYKDMPEEKQKKYTVFGGVTGYNNKLFNTNGYIYEMNTKKFLLGSQFEYGLKENLKFDSKISFDKIYSQPENSIWQSIYSTDALLTSGTWKNSNNLEANLAYRTKSGRVINVNYQYNQMGGYIINNMFLPMSSRHSINLIVNDAFALLPSGIKSVGYSDDNKGYVDVVTYIDKNQNGKFDRKDIKVKDVPVKFSWENNPTYTNRRGRAFPGGTEAGTYNIKIDTEKLPATLLVDKSQEKGKMIRIEARKTTKVEIPLISCIGNIKGKLKILDDFGRTMNIEDFIIVLNNEKGEEISYSTVDEYGNFYFSGISPGNYKIKLDDNFIYSNSLENCENNSELSVCIPYEYKKFIDIDNLELIYKSH